MPTNKTLFIIGAGFSKNYLNAKDKKDNYISPTNDDFFKNMKNLLDNNTYTKSKIHIDNLLKYICSSWNISYDEAYNFLNKTELKDMEKVFTDLSIRTSLFDSKGEAIKNEEMYDTMIELTSILFGKCSMGDEQNNIKEFIKLLKKEDLIITFNYDLILEKHINKFTYEGYQINPYQHYEKNEWKDINNKSNLNIFKLHGSINWLKCIECDTLLIDSQDQYYDTDIDIKRINELACPRCECKNTLKRIMIPPIQWKNYNNNPINYLWKKLLKKIDNKIDCIISIGYRIPDTDFTIRALLNNLNNKLSNKEKEKLRIIAFNKNNAGEVLRKYNEIFDIPVENRWAISSLEELTEKYRQI